MQVVIPIEIVDSRQWSVSLCAPHCTIPSVGLFDLSVLMPGVQLIVKHWIPGIGPAPDLLTELEVVRMLRLDPATGHRTVKHYVNTGQLKAERFGRMLKYRLADVLDFVKRKGELS